jgi:HPt (histidine-containing phosphotransfer) domain-containing protein
VFAQIRRMKPVVRRRVIGIFLGEAPASVDALGRAIEFRDQAALVDRTHSLKSSSGTLGALRFSALCRELEVFAKLGDFAAADRVFSLLLPEFAAVIGELSRAVHDLGDDS